MTISSSVPVTPHSGPTLDAFAATAATGEAVYVSIDGQSMQVLGTGVTPGGRSVTWVAPDVDTVTMFTEALARTHGQGIAEVVARELGLQPSPGKPLSSRTVGLALEMAQTCSQAMSGVDFATRLEFSAASGGAGFQAACQALGIDPASVDAAQRQRIDEAMQLKFEQAEARGQAPVPPDTAQQWLRELLQA